MKKFNGGYTYSAGEWAEWGYRPAGGFERAADPKHYADAWRAWSSIMRAPGADLYAADFEQFENDVIGLYHTRREAAEYLAACLAGAPGGNSSISQLVTLVDADAVLGWFSHDIGGEIIELEDVGVLLFVSGGRDAVREFGGPELWEA